MDAVGVVCEFDPLHRGHERLLRRAGESGRVLVCAMSGNFTQRGGAACVEKFARAEMAVPPCQLKSNSILPYFFVLGNGLLQFGAKKGII